ncbi:hypothetical protein PR202_gb17817 [Eleusine coracana subsp. coracana]|uniref:KIB1-4 beta-propeller domain-containing protein n=1 Tax=Eleusine coracana subsp. coracana TaxID=191504 RepID=A0AAV5F5Q5_ELECO|nr:hypothetical protein PR202_gb17817 [Eleusine coracana subsp. coracana]
MARVQSSPWPDLQPELVGLVLGLLPSIADRVRARAVCRAWRHHAAPLERPPFPWLSLLDGTFLSIPNGEIHRLPLPASARRVHGSLGNLPFLEHDGGGLSLTNPFSNSRDDAVQQLPNVSTIWRKDETTHPLYGERPIAYKLVHLSSSSSSSSLNKVGSPAQESHFAVLITDNSFGHTISVCRPLINTAALVLKGKKKKAAMFRVPSHGRLFDVAFCDGNLYALTCRKLFVLRVEYYSSSDHIKGGRSAPSRVTSMEAVMDYSDDTQTKFKSFSKTYKCAYWSYLVDSAGGRLLHVRRLVGVAPTVPDYERMRRSRTLSFEVFEADLICGRWNRVTTLGGQAIFVGPYSKSLPALGCGPREDCIYFMCDYDYDHTHWDYADPFRGCGVFDMKRDVITPLLADTDVLLPLLDGCKGRPSWFFPS